MDLNLFIDKLNEMSSEDVIGMCRSRGIKGVRFSSRYCILANLIKDETGRAVCVVGGLVRAKDNDRECYDIADTLTHVAARFDVNEYPDLVALETIDSLVDCRQGKTRSHAIRTMILDWLEVNGLETNGYG